MGEEGTERHLVVMGPMGVGKSTLAGLLGRALGRPVRDSDVDIERLVGRTGRTVAASEGVDALHELESAVLLGALAGAEPLVIAAAGWAIEDARCREALARRARVVVLDLAPADVVRRLGEADDEHRRSMDAAEIARVDERRRPLYRAVADRWLDATESPDALAGDVIAWLGPQAVG